MKIWKRGSLKLRILACCFTGMCLYSTTSMGSEVRAESTDTPTEILAEGEQAFVPLASTVTTVTVNTYADLKREVNSSNGLYHKVIQLLGNITLTENFSLTRNNVTIDGKGHALDTANYVFEIKNFTSTNKSIKSLTNLRIQGGVTTPGLKVYRARGVQLEDLIITGTVGTAPAQSSRTGVEIIESQVEMMNLSTSNHTTSGIIVSRESELTLSGSIKHENETRSIISKQKETVGTTTYGNNTIQFPAGTYLPENNDTPSGNTWERITYIQLGSAVEVSNEAELRTGIKNRNVTIQFKNDITISGADRLQLGEYAKIQGDGFRIIFAPTSDSYLYLTGLYNELNNLIIQGYKDEQVAISTLNTKGYFDSQGITQGGVFLKDVSLSPDSGAGAKRGIRIRNSRTFIENLKSQNHSMEAVSILNNAQGGSIVTFTGNSTHTNDNFAIKEVSTIAHGKDKYNQFIDNSKQYYDGGAYEDVISNQPSLVREIYKLKNKPVNTTDEFTAAIRERGIKIILEQDISLTTLIPKQGDELEDGVLWTKDGIFVDGQGHTVDFGGVNQLVLRGKNSQFENVTFQNSSNNGIQLYNARNVYLKETVFKNNAGTGILVNGSTARVENITTENNRMGGIQITRSRTLYNPQNVDSYVKAIGRIEHKEYQIYVQIVNLQMTQTALNVDGTLKPIAVPGRMQKNIFDVTDVANDSAYDIYKNDIKSAVLSDFYLDAFQFTGDDRNVQYDSENIDYMTVRKIMDVTKNVSNINGEDLTLVGDGIVDNTANLKKLILHAGNNGRTLYFPAGTYIITDSIDLLKSIGQQGLANFQLEGAQDAPAVIKGKNTTANNTLFIQSNAKDDKTTPEDEYREAYIYPISYAVFKNLFLDNVSLSFNGPFKQGLEFSNNAFLNGDYKKLTDTGGKWKSVELQAYITANNSKYTIKGNSFFRDVNRPGKGISLYSSTNSTVSHNFFGNLSTYKTGSVGQNDDPKRMLLTETSKMIDNALTAGLLSKTQELGNFFTGVNGTRRDKNLTISNNYFNMHPSRNITSDFPENMPISGINVANEGQRRDHLIYVKGYDGLSIYSNYFKGMENGGAGGVKLRNGSNAYIGSNYFDNVPLLTYIYADLSHEEVKLQNTIIYNNLLRIENESGSPHSGLLFYQSFLDGVEANLPESSTKPNKVNRPVFADIKNFIMYKNQFMTDNRDGITINKNAQNNLANFSSNENVYSEKDYVNQIASPTVIYEINNNGLDIPESTGNTVLTSIQQILPKFNELAAHPIPLQTAYVGYGTFTMELKKFEDKVMKLISPKNSTSEQLDVYKKEIEAAKKFQEQGQVNTQAAVNLYVLKIKTLAESVPEIEDDNKPNDGTIPDPDNNKPNDGTIPDPDDNKPNDGTTPDSDDNKPNDGTTPDPNHNKPNDSTAPSQNNHSPNNNRDPEQRGNGKRLTDGRINTKQPGTDETVLNDKKQTIDKRNETSPTPELKKQESSKGVKKVSHFSEQLLWIIFLLEVLILAGRLQKIHKINNYFLTAEHVDEKLQLKNESQRDKRNRFMALALLIITDFFIVGLFYKSIQWNIVWIQILLIGILFIWVLIKDRKLNALLSTTSEGEQ